MDHFKPSTTMASIGQKRILENCLRNSIDSGDFASHVERELSGGQPSPGAVVPAPNVMHRAADFAEELHLRPEKSKTGWFLSIVTTFVLASLAYLALTQDRIVLGGQSGRKHV